MGRIGPFLPAIPPTKEDRKEHRFGPAEFQNAANVSRETLDRLTAYVSLLADWNSRHNLVSAASLGEVWRRHVWDSAQLEEFIPRGAERLVDVGSGAGFPGVVLAVLRPELRVILFEATRKKCVFLESAAKELLLPLEIRNTRIEGAAPEPVDVVTARACAPLPLLLHYARPFQSRETINLFLKGQNVGAELSDARKIWNMNVVERPSRSGGSGTILEIRGLHRAEGGRK